MTFRVAILVLLLGALLNSRPAAARAASPNGHTVIGQLDVLMIIEAADAIRTIGLDPRAYRCQVSVDQDSGFYSVSFFSVSAHIDRVGKPVGEISFGKGKRTIFVYFTGDDFELKGYSFDPGGSIIPFGAMTHIKR